MTPLNVHQAIVLYVGLCYFLPGLLIFAMWEMLGPSYSDHFTLGPKRRAVLFVLSLGAVLRGSIFIFPGQLVATERLWGSCPGGRRRSCWPASPSPRWPAPSATSAGHGSGKAPVRRGARRTWMR